MHGTSLVVLDPALTLVVDVFPCEDGHAQVHALRDQVLAVVAACDLSIEDRDSCTLGFMRGVARRDDCFVARQHRNLPWEAVTDLGFAGVCDDVDVREQKIRLVDPESDASLVVRRLELLASPFPTPGTRATVNFVSSRSS